jgi:hypothetical protein
MGGIGICNNDYQCDIKLFDNLKTKMNSETSRLGPHLRAKAIHKLGDFIPICGLDTGIVCKALINKNPRDTMESQDVLCVPF